MSGENNFLIFDENKSSMQDDSTYEGDSSRLNGMGAGIANPALHNKLFYQQSIMSAAIAKVISDRGYDALDTVFNDLVESIDSAFADPNKVKQPVLFYSTNSGKLNSSGHADFASKKNNTTITITADSGDNKLVMTGSQGKQNIITTSGDITGFSADGVNNVLWDYATNQEIVTANQVYESNKLPADGDWVNGDFWLTYYGKNKYLGFKKVAGIRMDFEFSKLCEVSKAAGVLGTPVNFAYNGEAIIYQEDVGPSGVYLLTHDIGSIVKPPRGFYNDVKNTYISNGSIVHAGDSGFEIGMGSASGANGMSTFAHVNRKTAELVTADGYLWCVTNGSVTELFGYADAEIFFERAF